MSKNILILGASGMAGHLVATYLSEHGYATSTISARTKLNDDTTLIDVTDSHSLVSYLKENHFDVIINCVGLLVKDSDEHKDLATYINSYLPHQLSSIYKNTATKIIHLSTDCVFSGKNAPYTEAAWPDGELFYDRSKAMGEIVNQKDLTFRMSIIGPDMQKKGIGLFNWFYAQSGEINGFTESIWNGITTIELARAIRAAIDQNLHGLYHLVPNRNISKYELLNLFKRVFNRDNITINPSDGIVQDKTLICTRTDFSFELPDYPTMIKNMKIWIDDHKDLYQHYAEK